MALNDWEAKGQCIRVNLPIALKKLAAYHPDVMPACSVYTKVLTENGKTFIKMYPIAKDGKPEGGWSGRAVGILDKLEFVTATVAGNEILEVNNFADFDEVNQQGWILVAWRVYKFTVIDAAGNQIVEYDDRLVWKPVVGSGSNKESGWTWA
jgi:hypothetical protein